MPTINRLPLLGTPSSGDQIPVYAPNSGDARRMSINSLVDYFQDTLVFPDPENAAYIDYDPAGAGAVQRTVQSKLRDVVSVKDFGAVGDGVANDRAAVQAAFNASKRVYFPSGTYWMGSYATAENIINLSNLGAGVSILTDKSVELVCQTTANVTPQFFYLFANSHFSCGPIRFRDTGYDPAVNWKGAIGFYLDNNTSTSWGDVTFEAIYAKTMVAVMQIVGGDASNRIRGIHIGQLFSDDCYYGFNSQNQGDGVQIDNLIAFQNYRPYFVYGVADHKVKIFNRAARSTSGAVNISRSVGGLNTSGIDVTYVARDMAVGITHVLINHIDLLGGEISNVRVNLDIRSSVIYTPLRFVNYSGSGGSETSAASSNYVYDVTLAGSCDAQASAVTAVASYAGIRELDFAFGNNFTFDTTISNLFYLDKAFRAAAVTWTASSVNPVLGNGVLFSDYDIVGGICHYSVSLTAGSTTTFGTGEWFFSAPLSAKVPTIGSVWALDSGTAYYVGSCKIEAGSNNIQCFSNNSAMAFGSANPFAWAANDRLQLSIAYPIS
jgi:hypothetical protein